MLVRLTSLRTCASMGECALLDPFITVETGYKVILCRFLKIRNCELQALLPFLRGIELEGIDSFEESIPGDESIPLWNRFL